jgi:dTDP-4-amino-4,6-dideoxygalactose transaminase
MGNAGGFSFNYFKNMTCGEGGAVVTADDKVAQRARCMIDPCSFYWEGRDEDARPFANPGARVSEIQGAMMLAQLDRLPGLLTDAAGAPSSAPRRSGPGCHRRFRCR